MTVGLDLPDGFVPNSTFWLADASGRRLGLVNLRHSLTESGVIRGGRIGYEVRPSDRGKGYGTRFLALTLLKAREMGLTRVASLFPNEDSPLRLVTAVLMETSDEWESGENYLTMKGEN